MAASDFSNLLATTMQNYLPTMADAVNKGNPLCYKLEALGRIEQQGGSQITSGVQYAENKAFKAISGGDLLPLQQEQELTRTVYDWKTVTQTVNYSFDEDWINAGEQAVTNLVAEKTANAEKSLKNQFERMFLGEGGLADSVNDDGESTSKEFHGLKHLIGQNTKPVGGIDPTIKPFDEVWQANVVSVPASGSDYDVTVSKILLEKHRIEKAGAEKVDLIVTSLELWHKLADAIAANPAYRNTDAFMAEGGYNNILIGDTPVIYTDGPIDEGSMFLINMSYLKLITKAGKWFVMPDGFDRPRNQLVYYGSIVAMGNLIVTNRRFQGLLEFAKS